MACSLKTESTARQNCGSCLLETVVERGSSSLGPVHETPMIATYGFMGKSEFRLRVENGIALKECASTS